MLGLTESIMVLDIIFCCIPDIEYDVHMYILYWFLLNNYPENISQDERHRIVSIYIRSNKEREETKRSHIMLQAVDNVLYYCQ